MKKFMMTSPFQPAGRLGKGIYIAADNERLSYGRETSFPIIPVINGYAEDGETIEVIVNVSDYENARYNLTLLEEELAALCEEKHIRYTITTIETPYNNLLDTQLLLFEKLIDCTADGDTLYCCVTYGTKPVPMIQTMAVNYAYRIRKNVSIGCVVYGAVDFNTKEMNLYDITSLLYMDEIVRVMAEQKIENPTEKIKMLLK